MQPASSAGTSFDIVTNCGTFHGTMAATTPTGSRRTMTSVPSMPVRASSHGKAPARCSRKVSSIIHGAGACARLEKEIGEPISVGDHLGHLADLARRRGREGSGRRRCAPPGLSRGHGPSSNALRAAARRGRCRPSCPRARVATTSSVCGEITSSSVAGAGSTQSPPMNSLSRSSSCVYSLRSVHA